MFLQALCRWSRPAAPMLLALAAALLLPAAPAHGEGASREAELTAPIFLFPPVGSIGVDISWPQCGNGERPSGPLNFAVIGVNGGKMYTKNDCLGEMFRWAMNGRTQPQVYINTSGLPTDYTNSACSPTDRPCLAYMYGYNGAAMAHLYARSQGVDPRQWWLDVETANYWTAELFLNERVLAGAIEYLHNTGHLLGIYSTPYQWGRIAGGFMPRLPVWTAGAANLAEAAMRCSDRYAFGGGKVAMAQYVSEHFDTSYICDGGVRPKAIAAAVASGN